MTSASQAHMFGPVARVLADRGMQVHLVWCQLLRGDVSPVRALAEQGNPGSSLEPPYGRHVRHLMDHIRPDVLLIGHDCSTIDRLFIRHAHRTGAVVLLVQDGVLAATRRVAPLTLPAISRLCRGGLAILRSPSDTLERRLKYLWFEVVYGGIRLRRPYGRGNWDWFAVFGEAVKDRLVLEGLSPDRIVVTGSVKLDALATVRRMRSERSQVSTPTKQSQVTTIVLLTQCFVEGGEWNSAQRRAFVDAVIQCANSTGAKLIVKVHPREKDVRVYQEALESARNGGQVYRDTSLADLFLECSVVVTVSSTAALEAMACGIPAILFEPYSNEGADFYRDSGVLRAKTKDGLLAALGIVAEGGPQMAEHMRAMQEFVCREVHITEGSAAGRIACLVENIARSPEVASHA